MKFVDFGLDEEILKSIQKLGYKKPTDIQYKSIKPILRGEDVLAIAQTGTGKTAAFAIPVLHTLKRRKIAKRADGVKCLVMVPTHELALQLCEVFQKIGQHSGLNIANIIGGVSQDEQIKNLEKGTDVLIATPGRMFDLVSQGHLKLNRVEILILDEADHMLDLGFIKDIRDMMRFLPKRRQTLFFSATIDQKIKKLAYSLVSKPIRIQVSPKNPVAKNVIHSVAFVEMDDKRFFLERIINENPDSKILVFVRTKVRAERVCSAMERVEINAMTIHGDKSQNDRSSALSRFKNNDLKVLIATDVSARGIDGPSVDFVINYDLPEQDENYVHRVGRTGRGTQKGRAISFCSTEEKPLLEKIEDYIGSAIDISEIDASEYQETLDFSVQQTGSWQKLLAQEEQEGKKTGMKKNKKRKKK